MTSRLYPVLLIAFMLPTVAADTTKFVNVDSFILSEPIAIDAVDSDWDASYHPNGEKQVASVWLESGIKKGKWSYSALFREEQQLDFSSSAADLYFTIANDKELTTDRLYKIELDAYRFRSYGARVGRHFTPSHKLNVTIGTSLFYASKLISGSLSGQASADSADEYHFNFDADYFYHEDIILGRKGTTAPDGIGLTLDLDLNWKPTDRIKINAKLKDLAGAIYWKDVPFTEAVANSDTATVDSNGFSQVDPALVGLEGYKSSYTQSLRPSANLSADFALSNSPYTASIKSKHYKNVNLFSLGGSKSSQNRKLALHYWPQIQTIEANYKSKYFDLSLGLDDLNFSDTRTFWLTVQYQ